MLQSWKKRDRERSSCAFLGKKLEEERYTLCWISKLAATALVIPVTTATVERSYSSMRQVKTRLRSCLRQETLDYAMRICIEGPEKFNDSELEAIVQDWKDRKKIVLRIRE